VYYFNCCDTFTCADAEIGFNATEVTVIEGEPVLLTTVLRNNNLTTSDYGRFEYFTIKIQGGNATGIYFKFTLHK
jgi:hypothetical protein